MYIRTGMKYELRLFLCRSINLASLTRVNSGEGNYTDQGNHKLVRSDIFFFSVYC